MLFGDQPPLKVVFGTTFVNRPTFPTDIQHDCFGNNQTPLRGVPNLGPGSYENDDKTTFRYVLDHQPMSRRGYTFNARTEKREVFVPKTDVPSPDTYQMDLTDVPEKKRAFKPFNVGGERLPSLAKSAKIPGPGTYECDVRRNRQVHMRHSFGGASQLIPVVKTKCMPLNKDKCEICRKQPIGDYYQYRNETLCAPCFNFNWQWEEKFKKSISSSLSKSSGLFGYSRARWYYCSSSVDDRTLKKLQRKEAYLSLYWP